MDVVRQTNETQRSSKTSELSDEQTGQFAQAEETMCPLDSPVTEAMSAEWTDEKHSLYLKSMEASFVNQLYNSSDFLGWRSEKSNLSNITSSRQIQRTSSGQFKVLRGGCWQKINFPRPDFKPNKAHDSRTLLVSPWIRHFKHAGKPQTLVSPSPAAVEGSEGTISSCRKKAVTRQAATSSGNFDACHSNLCHHDTVGGSTGVMTVATTSEEVSDQNFVGEEIEGEKTSSMCSSKKMKTTQVDVDDSSCHDQVVPVPHIKPTITENGSL